jgi:PleD family two-component response regulator
VEDMIQTADAAMYAAKSKGKKQVVQRYIAV